MAIAVIIGTKIKNEIIPVSTPNALEQRKKLKGASICMGKEKNKRFFIKTLGLFLKK